MCRVPPLLSCIGVRISVSTRFIAMLECEGLRLIEQTRWYLSRTRYRTWVQRLQRFSIHSPPISSRYQEMINLGPIKRWPARLPEKCLGSLLTLSSQQIDDTVGVMRENINKVSQRGERLDSLQDKTDNLAVSAQGFRRGANRVRKQMWWKGAYMFTCQLLLY